MGPIWGKFGNLKGPFGGNFALSPQEGKASSNYIGPRKDKELLCAGKWMYTHTTRKYEDDQWVETRTNVSRQIYEQLLVQVKQTFRTPPRSESLTKNRCRPTDRATSPSVRPGGVSIGTINITRWTSTAVLTRA